MRLYFTFSLKLNLSFMLEVTLIVCDIIEILMSMVIIDLMFPLCLSNNV